MDDKRVVVDLDLRTLVLDPLNSRDGIDRLHLVYAFTAFALAKNLQPLPPVKKDTISGDVSVDADVYRLVAHQIKTDEPRRVAHELANAGMNYVLDRVKAGQELIDVFELSWPN